MTVTVRIDIHAHYYLINWWKVRGTAHFIEEVFQEMK